LGMAREGRDEVEVKSGERSGGLDTVEVGVEGAQKDFGGEGGFGKNEGAGVGRSVVE